jgi:hypothetical protein
MFPKMKKPILKRRSKMAEINLVALKAAVKELNAMELEGIPSIRTVGISTNKMAVLFIENCNKANDIDEDILSDAIIEVYNTLPELEDIPAEQEKKEAKPTKEKKEAKPPKEKKEPKPPKESNPIAKSRYGHVKSAKSGELDDMLFEGATLQEMMDKCGVPRVRVVSHLNHLKHDLGLTLLVVENKENTSNTRYQVKEETFTGTAVTKQKKEKSPVSKDTKPTTAKKEVAATEGDTEGEETE